MFSFKITSCSVNLGLRLIIVVALLEAAVVWWCHISSCVCVSGDPSVWWKTKERNGKYWGSFASFLFLKLFEGWNNEEHRSMNEQKASWMSAEKLSFSTFLSFVVFFFFFLYGPWRWTHIIFIHAFFYSVKQKERKMDLYWAYIHLFIYFFPLTHPHYRSLCWRRDRNGALWAKEWPIHPFRNIPLHKRYCCIFHSFVEMFPVMAASLLCLMTLRGEVRHVLLFSSWHCLFLSSLVGFQN